VSVFDKKNVLETKLAVFALSAGIAALPAPSSP